jgi:ribonucleotide monophosphatase NagD (HAD superfamily)
MANFFPPGFENESNIIAIDFDGVIHNADKGWYDGTCYGDPIYDAIDSIKILAKTYRIVIFTAKAKSNRPLVNGKTGTELVKEWLEKYDIYSYVSEITSEKPRAFLYIDDNGYRFENWNNTLQFIKNIQ